ncbi:putative STE group serine/threonine-protein kinase [Trypanosoma cruzi]|nr:putative STE group serine/threonine-protein kinase [Trypanosoma cruzi]
MACLFIFWFFSFFLFSLPKPPTPHIYILSLSSPAEEGEKKKKKEEETEAYTLLSLPVRILFVSFFFFIIFFFCHLCVRVEALFCCFFVLHRHVMETPPMPRAIASPDDAYLQQRGIPGLWQQLSGELMEKKPANHLAFMLQWLSRLAGTAEGVERAQTHNDAGEKTMKPFFLNERYGGSDTTEAENDDNVLCNSPALAEFLPVKGLLVDDGAVGSCEHFDGVPRPLERLPRCGDALVETPGVDVPMHPTYLSDTTMTRTDPNHKHVDPEVLSSTKHLMEIVQRLPPSEHIAACVFLESLLDKKELAASTSKISAKREPSLGATMNGESNGCSPSDVNRRSSPSALSTDAVNTLLEFKLARTHLQELVNDALTASILAREKVNSECMDCKLHMSSTDTVASSPHGIFFSGARSELPLAPLKLQRETDDVPKYASEDTPLSSTLPAGRFSAHTLSMSGFGEEGGGLSQMRQFSASEEELDVVREGISTRMPFCEFDEIQVECVVRSMERLTWDEWHLHTLRNELLFVYSGTLLLLKEGRVLQRLSKGDVFDGLHLSREAKDESSHEVRAVSSAIVFLIEMDVFRSLLDNEKKARYSMFLRLMERSLLLSGLSLRTRKRLADSLRIRKFKAGSMLMQKGRPMEWVSFVFSGVVRRRVDDEAGATRAVRKNASLISDVHWDYLLETRTGGVIGAFELIFRSHSLTDAVAASRVLVAQLHVVYFEAIMSQRYLDEMRFTVLSDPLTPWLLQHATEEVRLMAEQAEKEMGSVPKKVNTQETGQNLYSTTRSSVLGLTMNRARRRGPVQARNLSICSAGEIVYAGKKNIYRFPLSVLEISNTVVIAVVSDGVIIRWNAAAGRVTGFQYHDVLGQRIYRLLATETTRNGMREQLLQAERFVGSWDDYVASGLSSPCVYRFRQASEVYYVNLLLSIVPSCLGTAGDVMLLVGRETDNQAVVNYIEDAVRWMRDVLQPQLNAFQRRVESIGEKDWNMSPDDGKRLLGHVETCNKLMERYMRLSSLNLESMKEMWKPVRIHHTLRQFAREAVQLVGVAENRFTLFLDEGLPKHEIFFNVEHVLEVLRRVVVEVNKAGTGILISVFVCVVEPTAEFAVSRKISCPIVVSRRASIATHVGLASLSLSLAPLSFNPPNSDRSSLPPFKEGGRVCSATEPQQVIDGPSSLSMRRIRIVVTDNVEMDDGSEGDKKVGVKTSSTANLEGKETENPRKYDPRRRMATIKECEQMVANMCGTLSFHTTRFPLPVNTLSIELPLLPVPWVEEEEDKENVDPPITTRPFTVIVADRDAKQRNILCRLMWSRRHAVVPVTSLREAMMNVETGGADVLVIDPLYLEATEEEYAALRDGTAPFEALRQQTQLVVVLYADDFNDWRVKKLMGYSHVIELPKPASGALLHLAMHEAERLVMCMREDEEKIALLRMAFTEFQPDRHKLGRLLGRGAYGEVFEVEDLLTGGKLAVKRMYLEDGVLADDAIQELVATTSLRHENIIHYFYCQKESDTQLRLYMELASGGTLRDKIRRQGGPLPLEEIVRHLKDLCRGLAYLHSKNYVHRDMKTANALIDHHGRTKIGDFGTVKCLKRSSEKLYTVAGTPQFMAPEVMNADSTKGIGYNQKADIWSLGCVALELATGKSPFSYLNFTSGMGIFVYVSKLTDTPDLSVIKDENPLLYAFIESCLCIDPDKRPTAQELIHHELLQEAEHGSRNKQLARKVEMVEKLKRYAAIDAEGEEDEEEEEEEEDEVNDAGSSVSVCNAHKGGNCKNDPLVGFSEEKRCELQWKRRGGNPDELLREQSFFASSTFSSGEEDERN